MSPTDVIKKGTASSIGDAYMMCDDTDHTMYYLDPENFFQVIHLHPLPDEPCIFRVTYFDECRIQTRDMFAGCPVWLIPEYDHDR